MNIDLYSILSYIWKRLPIILMFINSFIIYRVIVISGLGEIFIKWLMQKSGNKIVNLLFFIILSTALMSCFIPNAITILILLPILKEIDSKIICNKKEKNRYTTCLTLAAIYGANIGGMGSLTGTPSNLLLIGVIDFYKISEGNKINFFNWLIWAMPLVLFFIIIAWLIIILIGLPKNSFNVKINIFNQRHFEISDEKKAGGFLCMLFIFFWSIDNICSNLIKMFASIESFICIIYFLVFGYLSFLKPYGKQKKIVLKPNELLSEFPKRGIIFLGIFLIFIILVQTLSLNKKIMKLFIYDFINETPKFLLLLSIILVVIFLTEIFSNMVVASTFFTLAYQISTSYNIHPLILMISVSLASTCAFMTPVATPCNALAFGEMKGTSLLWMISLGFLLNIIGALIISFWINLIIPLIYL
ncbi:MAG: SLC13 family permease [Desulfobacterales bacterium]|nr:SLC13 family permease [Desulfobacterales bacterium]